MKIEQERSDDNENTAMITIQSDDPRLEASIVDMNSTHVDIDGSSINGDAMNVSIDPNMTMGDGVAIETVVINEQKQLVDSDNVISMFCNFG